MATTLINAPAAMAILGKQISEELRIAAEPYIKATLQEVEKKLRARLAEVAVAIVKKEFSIHHAGNVMELRVNLGESKTP